MLGEATGDEDGAGAADDKASLRRCQGPEVVEQPNHNFYAKGWVQHALDPCLFMSFRKFQEGDDEHEAFEKDGEYHTLDGLAGLHVDDSLGCGEGVKWKDDANNHGKVKKVDSYQSRVGALAEEYISHETYLSTK